MRIIEKREIVEDRWARVMDDEPLPAEGDVIVSLTRWRSDREALVAREGRVGVRCPGETEPEVLAPDFGALDLIALEIPKFTDGRAYSTARLLRERYRFAGQLRAVGDVLPDQVFYLSRVGFDAFELAPGKKLETALAALDTFTVLYQPAADQPLPLWRRTRVGERSEPDAERSEASRGGPARASATRGVRGVPPRRGVLGGAQPPLTQLAGSAGGEAPPDSIEEVRDGTARAQTGT